MDRRGVLTVAREKVALPGSRRLSHGTLRSARCARPSVSDSGSRIPPAAPDYERAGFDSSVAALEACRAERRRYDLVLTDETMPDVNGVELAREMRRVRPELRIVLMSGYSGAQLTERAHAVGVAEVLR